MPQLSFSLPLALLLALSAAVRAETVTLAPAADNTLYESTPGSLSNGQGVHLFAGVTGTDALRRALLRFDVAAALPAGATITSAELRLFMSKTTITLPEPVGVHRVLGAWGEGASDAAGEEGEGDFAEPGDATWQHRFHPDTFWIADGGDFESAPSATTDIGPVGAYAWASTAPLVADVQHWLDHPEDDHGWVVVGFEGGGQSSKRFNSRENPDIASRPALVIEYSPVVTCAGDFTAYGAGLAGTGDFVPLLSGAGCPQIGDAIVLEVSGGLGGAGGLLFAGLTPGAVPFKGGTFLLGNFVVQVALVLGGAPGDPGEGVLPLPAVLPPDSSLQGLDVFLQAAFQDAGAPWGVSLSAGLVVGIG